MATEASYRPMAVRGLTVRGDVTYVYAAAGDRDRDPPAAREGPLSGDDTSQDRRKERQLRARRMIIPCSSSFPSWYAVELVLDRPTC
ncbi:hypothetical protein [Streptomyces sp.]|uniref:hypothetical protein n=1 Tax=Streptomyces sp. TaxID=1931 RepID=UPI002D7987E3|nr:hypothetical protein [Streptomyces sp.]HET6356487.1 hypothetical protein [Streptomyces sp.]